MASVKISELNNLNAVTSDDFIPLVDSGSLTTYRVPITAFSNWVEASCSVVSSSHAVSSSYALTSSYSISSSWANYGLSSSYALTASYFSSVSSSHALNSDLSQLSLTASCLQGSIMSWEQSLILSSSLILARSASIKIARKRNPNTDTELKERDTIWFNKDYGTEAASDDYGRIYFVEDQINQGKLVFDLGDSIPASLLSRGPNIDYYKETQGGFLWESITSHGSPFASASLMYLTNDGRLLVRAVEARDFTQSLDSGVGFRGTASWAQNLVGGTATITTLPIGSIVDYAGASDPADSNWVVCDGRVLNRTTYSSLFTILGTTWGAGNGSTTFNIPDLTSRMTIGDGSSYHKISSSVGNTGGGDHIQNHFHYILRAQTPSNPSGITHNDDVYFWWMNPLNTIRTDGADAMFPQILSPYGGYRALYYVAGADDTGRLHQPAATAASPTDTNWNAGSSFGLSTTSADMMPPYAVMKKIIRIS